LTSLTGKIPWNKGKKGIYSAEHRAKISAGNTGKKISPETRAKISASNTGKIPWNKGKKGIYSAEHRAEISAWQIGRKRSPETRAKISASKTGKKLSPEHRAKLSANTPRFWQGKKRSPETKAKLSAINTGKKLSPETKAKLIASLTGRKPSPETRAKISASKTGKKHSPETIAKLKASHNKPETRAKHSAHRLTQIIPTKDTKLEIELQRLLNTNNIQFTKHKPILGQPDIFIEPNICIFADGDYPHGWNYLQGKDYSKYRALNNEHFEKIIKKDQSVTTRLEAQGYKVLRLWEHEINREPKKCLDRIRALL